MPIFFIDSDDGTYDYHDIEGYNLSDVEVARRAAINVLPDMARERLPNGDQRTFVSSVRNEEGIVLYVATLKFTGEWQLRGIAC